MESRIAKISKGDLHIVVQDNGGLFGYVSGIKLFNLTESIVPLRIALKTPDSNPDICITYIAENKNVVGGLLKDLDLEDKVKLLETKSDEINDNTPAQTDVIPSKKVMREFYGSLNTIDESFRSIHSVSESLVRTRIPPSMWGSSKISSIIEPIKLMVLNGSKWDKFEAILEKLKRYNITLETNTKIHEFVRIYIEFINGLRNLYLIDKDFKKYTGYPATWFFDISVFYDFRDSYEDFIQSLMRFLICIRKLL